MKLTPCNNKTNGGICTAGDTESGEVPDVKVRVNSKQQATNGRGLASGRECKTKRTDIQYHQ